MRDTQKCISKFVCMYIYMYIWCYISFLYWRSTKYGILIFICLVEMKINKIIYWLVICMVKLSTVTSDSVLNGFICAILENSTWCRRGAYCKFFMSSPGKKIGTLYVSGRLLMYGHQNDPTFALSCRSFKPSFIAHSSSAKCYQCPIYLHWKLSRAYLWEHGSPAYTE